jgi:hypothetical protein
MALRRYGSLGLTHHRALEADKAFVSPERVRPRDLTGMDGRKFLQRECES